MEFLAMIILIVYVGAVAVLFLFVVMMLEIKFFKFFLSSYISLILSLIVLVPFYFIEYSFLKDDLVEVTCSTVISYIVWDNFDFINHAEKLGFLLYTVYAPFCIIASFILLIAMIGAIVLTIEPNEKLQRQQVFQQVSRNIAYSTVRVC
jgi:NADH-quinone oxidoreductase subunit J